MSTLFTFFFDFANSQGNKNHLFPPPQEKAKFAAWQTHNARTAQHYNSWIMLSSTVCISQERDAGDHVLFLHVEEQISFLAKFRISTNWLTEKARSFAKLSNSPSLGVGGRRDCMCFIPNEHKLAAIWEKHYIVLRSVSVSLWGCLYRCHNILSLWHVNNEGEEFRVVLEYSRSPCI